MAQNIKVNGVTFTGVDYVYLPKADGSGNAVYRDLSNFQSGINISDLFAGTATDINDVNGEVTGTVSYVVFYDYDSLVNVNLPKATATNGTCFQNCANIETIKMNSVESVGQSSYRSCPKLTLVEVESATSFGNNTFDGSSLFGTLVIGKYCVATLGNSVFASTKIASGTGKIYVYADWIPLYRSYSGWASYAVQMDIAETYHDPTALEYNVTVTPPTGYKPYVQYTTSKGTWYGKDRAIAGGSTDTLQYSASCPGLVTKTGSISIDDSDTSISLDLSDMAADSDFNGYSITNLDFTNAEFDYSNNCALTNNFSDWYYNVHGINGIGGFASAKYFTLAQTIPSTSGMNKPTFVWEALVDMTSAGTNARKTLYSCGRSSSSAVISIGSSDISLWRNNVSNLVEDLDLTNGWHHIGVVINATNSYIYVDGELKLTASDTGMYSQFTAATHRLGHKWSSTGEYFLGRLKKLVTCIRDIADPTVADNCEFVLLS